MIVVSIVFVIFDLNRTVRSLALSPIALRMDPSLVSKKIKIGVIKISTIVQVTIVWTYFLQVKKLAWISTVEELSLDVPGTDSYLGFGTGRNFFT